MKISYIKSFALAGIMLFSASACKKVLEPELTYAIEASRLTTIIDFERVLNGGYAFMRNDGYYRFGYAGGGDVGTDNMIETSASLGNNRSLAQWYYNSGSTGVSRLWSSPYQVVNQANAVLDNLDNLTETAPGQKNRIRGQALALRALAHFDLMRFFAAEYDRNSSALGVAIKTKSEATFPPRSTVKECYDFIYKDLTEAEELLGDVDVAVNGIRKTRLDIHGVRALRARVSLYAKDWADAKAYTDKVIAESGVNLGSISGSIGVGLTASAINNTTSFQSVWFNDLNSGVETIFAVAFNVGQGAPGNFPLDGVNAYTVSSDWRNLFVGVTTNDVRFNVTYNGAASPAAASYQKFSGRFNGTSIARDGNVDVKVFRIAEMYLIRAEANLNLGNETDARNDIHTLRLNRIAGYSPASGIGNILEAIQIERRKELVGEGHRWFDARRYNLGFDRGTAPGQSDCPSTAPDCSIQAGNFRFVYPIPLGEIQANPAMKSQQNPGW